MIPSLLGFSLGAYAILFSLVTNEMKIAVKKTKGADHISFFDKINALFFHFIVVQVAALLCSFAFSGSAIFYIFKYVFRISPLIILYFDRYTYMDRSWAIFF